MKLGTVHQVFGVAACACLATGAQATGPDEAAKIDGLEATCLAAPYTDATSTDQAVILELVRWLRLHLGRHPTLVSTLADYAPEICLTPDLFGAKGFYDPSGNRIMIRKDLDTGLMRAVAIHELRHAEQARLGICPAPDLSMEQTALVTMALEADASAISLVVAWDVKERGNDVSVWSALVDWPSMTDIALSYRTEYETSGDVARAAAMAFSQWYESDWRRNSYFSAASSAYLDRQDETKALPQYGEAPRDLLQDLCLLPSGDAYPCAGPGELECAR